MFCNLEAHAQRKAEASHEHLSFGCHRRRRHKAFLRVALWSSSDPALGIPKLHGQRLPTAAEAGRTARSSILVLARATTKDYRFALATHDRTRTEEAVVLQITLSATSALRLLMPWRRPGYQTCPKAAPAARQMQKELADEPKVLSTGTSAGTVDSATRRRCASTTTRASPRMAFRDCSWW